ncbi:MAG: hypothetical protein QOE53_1998, partial [Pseudonocardiales bacterium]|nr:hypothetical protein [Pseudonocardiales bacterium]
GPATATCTRLVHGQGSWTIPLSRRLGANEYFVQLDYLQQKASVLYIAIHDQDGKTVEPVGGQRLELPHQLASLYLRLPLTTVESLVVRSASPVNDICIGAIVVGVPFAQGTR